MTQQLPIRRRVRPSGHESYLECVVCARRSPHLYVHIDSGVCTDCAVVVRGAAQ